MVATGRVRGRVIGVTVVVVMADARETKRQATTRALARQGAAREPARGRPSAGVVDDARRV
ncbi:MAG: hypothetical protein K0A98_08930, partial [Trueperaceae bacterium]|nr:hypothetical protein [Trueperaceae bacterium]